MGKGKGVPEFWVDVIRTDRILFELEGIDAAEAREAMRLASHKLPIKTRFISRELRELR
jgi:large subunit ribosomal protein L16